jgi:hypothetical protein
MDIYPPCFYGDVINKAKKVKIWHLWTTPLSTIVQLYRGSQFYWGRKPKYLEKTTTYHKSLTNCMP